MLEYETAYSYVGFRIVACRRCAYLEQRELTIRY